MKEEKEAEIFDETQDITRIEKINHNAFTERLVISETESLKVRLEEISEALFVLSGLCCKILDEVQSKKKKKWFMRWEQWLKFWE